MSQRWDQGRNQKTPWNKLKWHNNLKSVGYWGSNPKRKIHSITGLSQKQEKSQINNLTSNLKELEKEQQIKSKVNRRKEIIKIREEIE